MHVVIAIAIFLMTIINENVSPTYIPVVHAMLDKPAS